MQQLVEAFAPHLRLHHHARAAADGSIIHGMVHVVRPVAQVVRGDFDQALLLRLAEQAQVEHFEIFREYGHDIDLHNVPQYRYACQARRVRKGAGIIASALLKKQRIRAPE